MSQLLYKIINPPISLLLKSRLHGVMSHNTMLVEFVGRKSGNTMRTPVSYHVSDNHIHGFTSRKGLWWRNLQGGKPVRLLIKGSWMHMKSEVIIDEPGILEGALVNFLTAVPRDASHSNVRLDDQGQPDEEDVKAAVKHLALLRFENIN
jgi:hypothetical protein